MDSMQNNIPPICNLMAISHGECDDHDAAPPEIEQEFWLQAVVRACKSAARIRRCCVNIDVPCLYANNIATAFYLNRYLVRIQVDFDCNKRILETCTMTISWYVQHGLWDIPTVKMGDIIWMLKDCSVLVPSIDRIWRGDEDPYKPDGPTYYDFQAALELGRRNYFPEGYRLPTEQEWDELMSHAHCTYREPLRAMMGFPYAGIYQEKIREKSYYWTEKRNQDGKVSVASISPSGYGIASVPDCRGCSIRLVKDDCS